MNFEEYFNKSQKRRIYNPKEKMNPYEYFKQKLIDIFNNESGREIDFQKGYDKENAAYEKLGLKSHEVDYLIKMRNYKNNVKYTFKEWYELPEGYKTAVYEMEENEKSKAGLFNWYAKIENQKVSLN